MLQGYVDVVIKFIHIFLGWYWCVDIFVVWFFVLTYWSTALTLSICKIFLTWDLCISITPHWIIFSSPTYKRWPDWNIRSFSSFRLCLLNPSMFYLKNLSSSSNSWIWWIVGRILTLQMIFCSVRLLWQPDTLRGFLPASTLVLVLWLPWLRRQRLSETEGILSSIFIS